MSRSLENYFQHFIDKPIPHEQDMIAILDSQDNNLLKKTSLEKAVIAYTPQLQNAYVKVTWDNTQPDPACTVEGSFLRYWREMRCVTLADNGDVNTVLATGTSQNIVGDTDGTDGQVMTEFQRVWYKNLYDGDGHLEGFELSMYPLAGFTLHPSFSWGDGREHIYIAAYEAYRDTVPTPDVLCSRSGVTPTTDSTIAQFRADAEARGDGWCLEGHYEAELVAMLFYAYYGTRDSQGALPGYTEESGWNTSKMRETGRSNILTTMNGSVDADLAGVDDDLTNLSAGDKIANRFLWIENIFGHIWKFNDRITYVPEFDFDPVNEVLPGHESYVEGWNADWGKDLQAVYATADIRKSSSAAADIAADYDKIDVLPISVATTASIQKTGKGFVPTVGDGNTSQNFCATFYSYLTDTSRPYLRVVLAGGRLLTGSIAGVACRFVHVRLSSSDTAVGARLAFLKI